MKGEKKVDTEAAAAAVAWFVPTHSECVPCFGNYWEEKGEGEMGSCGTRGEEEEEEEEGLSWDLMIMEQEEEEEEEERSFRREEKGKRRRRRRTHQLEEEGHKEISSNKGHFMGN